MTPEPLQNPVPFEKAHDVSAFDCGAPPLNDFLRKYAWQNQQNRSARTYFALRGNRVVGYYSLAAGSVEDALGCQIAERWVTPSFGSLAIARERGEGNAFPLRHMAGAATMTTMPIRLM